MSQPVTSNPLIIMLINMTVVFLVLIALGIVIDLIHKIDPTAKKEKAPAEPAAPALTAVPSVTQSAPAGLSPEIVAVIAAAVASYGYGMDQIRAIRPIARDGWKQSGRNIVAERLL